MDDAGRRLEAARAGYRSLRPAVEAGEPWPLATAFGVEPEASWGPREVLTHVAEMLPFWLGEWERVQAGDGTPTPFGRVAADPLRVGIIERDRSLPLRDLFDRIDVGIRRWVERLADQPADAADPVGVHQRLGELTASAIFTRFVLDHLEDHERQLREALGLSG